MTIESVSTDKETAQLNMMKVIWLGLLFYSCILVFVAFKVLAPREVREVKEELILQIVAIIALIASHRLQKYLLKNVQNQNKKRTDIEKIKAAFAPFVIALSMSETVVILGFVLVILSGQPDKILPFAMAGILNIIYFYPKKEKILSQF